MNSIQINGKGKSIEVIIDGDESSSIHPASLYANKLSETALIVNSENPATVSFFIDDVSILTVDGETFANAGDAAIAINELANFNTGGSSSGNNGSGIAEDRPNTWIVNQEYDFGEGMFGQRFKSNSYSMAQVLSPMSQHIGIYEVGGWIMIDARVMPVPHGALGTRYAFVSQSRDDLNIMLEVSVGDPNEGYDIWIKYTKIS